MNPFAQKTEGVWLDLPAETYHAAPGVSHSMLKNMHPRPAHLLAYLQEKREPTPAMILGTLVHSCVLEPDKPLPQIAVKPANMKFSTNEGKAWRAEQIKAGRLIIGEDANATLKGTVASIAAHPICQQIFANGVSEVSIFHKINLAGTVLRKARLDWVPPGNALVDVKTCQDASPEAFAKDILNHRYHSQGAYYLDAWNDSQELLQPLGLWQPKECFVIVAVEKAPPYLVAVYTLHYRAVGKGRARNIDDLGMYIRCASENHWPGYSEEMVTLDLPEWSYKEGRRLL